jgi:hypothetical protein
LTARYQSVQHYCNECGGWNLGQNFWIPASAGMTIWIIASAFITNILIVTDFGEALFISIGEWFISIGEWEIGNLIYCFYSYFLFLGFNLQFLIPNSKCTIKGFRALK